MVDTSSGLDQLPKDISSSRGKRIDEIAAGREEVPNGNA
jgi:hypothetical protein